MMPACIQAGFPHVASQLCSGGLRAVRRTASGAKKKTLGMDISAHLLSFLQRAAERHGGGGEITGRGVERRNHPILRW